MGLPFILPQTESCLFCEVIGNKLKKGIVEEAELTLTVVSNRQFSPGQIMVIPRRHAPTLFDLTDEEVTAIMLAARRAGRAISEAYDSEGMLLYQNNGAVSHQEVPHFHLHVVPLKAVSITWGSGPPHIAAIEGRKFRKPEGNIEVSLEEECAVAEHIKQYLKKAE